MVTGYKPMSVGTDSGLPNGDPDTTPYGAENHFAQTILNSFDVDSGDLTAGVDDFDFGQVSHAAIDGDGLDRGQAAELLGWELEHMRVNVKTNPPGTAPALLKYAVEVYFGGGSGPIDQKAHPNEPAGSRVDTSMIHNDEPLFLRAEVTQSPGHQDTAAGTGGSGGQAGNEGRQAMFYRQAGFDHGPIIDRFNDTVNLLASLQQWGGGDEDIIGKFQATLHWNVFNVPSQGL